MTIKAILFDIDNTLIDYYKMKRLCSEAAIEAMIAVGLKTDKKKALVMLYNLFEEYGMDHPEIFQILVKKIQGKFDYRFIVTAIIAYRKFKDNTLIPYPKVIPTLIELKKKYKLGIVSDAPKIQAWTRLVTMQLDYFFDAVITKGDVKKQKTHLAPFKAAIKALNLKSEEVIMVGDRIERDIQTPKKMGIKTVYARYGDPRPAKKGKSGADFEINNLSELLKIVKRLE